MSAGIRDGVGGVALRQVRVFRITVEGELKDSSFLGYETGRAMCTRPAVITPRSSAKNGRAPNFFCTALKNSAPGPGTHCPTLSGGRSSRHVPCGSESTKVIQPNRVDVREQGAHPIDAPAKAASPMGLPVVHRVTPKLPIGAEVVWRYAGYEKWVEVIIEQEQLGVRPNIARIRRNEKGQIANQADALGTRAFLEPFALPEQQELRKADLLDSVRQFTASPS